MQKEVEFVWKNGPVNNQLYTNLFLVYDGSLVIGELRPLSQWFSLPLDITRTQFLCIMMVMEQRSYVLRLFGVFLETKTLIYK